MQRFLPAVCSGSQSREAIKTTFPYPHSACGTCKSLLKTHLFFLAFGSSVTSFWLILFFYLILFIVFEFFWIVCHFSWGYILLMCSTLVIFVVSHVINKFDFGDFCNDSWFIALMYKNPLSCHLVLIYFDSIIHSFMLWVMLHSEIHQQIYLLHINSSPLDWCLFFSPLTFPLLNLYDTYWDRHELAIFLCTAS